MALDIPAIARAATGKTWAVISSVLTDATLTDAPTVTRAAATELESIVWGHTFALKAFFWDDKETVNEAGDQAAMDAPLRPIKRKALFRVVDCPGLEKPSTLAQITEGAKVWNVELAEAPPGGAIFILTLRQ